MKPICTIVGMGEGISLSVAKQFGKEGFAIAMIARSPEKLAVLSKKLTDEGVENHSFIADAGDFNLLNTAFNQVHSALGQTQVLVYNAAVLRQGKPSHITADTLVEDFKVNVAGALTSVHQVLPAMKEKKQGTILLTGGGLAIEPFPLYTSLAIGKSGIRSLAFSLFGELNPLGIHVATITISGIVKPGTHFDPDKIAEKYWELHLQEKGKFQKEIIYK